MPLSLQNLFISAKRRLGQQRPSHAEINKRFQHRQVDVWTRAFAQADRNGRIAVGLGLLLALSLALNIVQQGRPADVIFIDQLADPKYFRELASPQPPRQFEVERFAQTWARDFLSRDAVTAKEDLARALSVCEIHLQRKLKSQLIDSGEIDKIRDAFVHTAIRVEQTTVKSDSADRMLIEISGTRSFTAMSGDRKNLHEAFTMQLVLAAVPRTETTPNGLLVEHITGSFGDNHPLVEE